MIVCDVCRKNTGQKEEQAQRYIFPIRRIDQYGPHNVDDIYSVDLCAEHARAFWAEFANLMDRYSAGFPCRETPPAVPQSGGAWAPEVGKHYGKPGDSHIAFVDHIDKKGKVRYRDNAGDAGALTPAEFADRFGMTPVKG